MGQRDVEFEAYLNEIVRRDREGLPSEGLSPAVFREMVGRNAPTSRKPSKVDKSWQYVEQERQLETLLSWRLGRSRAHAVASDLMREFGSLPAILAASEYRLNNVSGVKKGTIETLKTIRDVSERMAFASIEDGKPIISCWKEMLSYLQTKLAFVDIEIFHILFLDIRMRLISDETQQRGTFNHVHAYPREIMRRCLELNASSILLCHNHPSGDSSPSMADIRLTQDIADLGKMMGVTVQDHLIIGKFGHTSMRSLRLIREGNDHN